MAVRLFNCKGCGHHLRLGAAQCRNCDADAPRWNVSLPLYTVLGITVATALLGTAVLSMG